eukprot:Skav200622  [mRNA]  locus=scaffold2029:85446:86341:+ [translate_table: standard]
MARDAKGDEMIDGATLHQPHEEPQQPPPRHVAASAGQVDTAKVLLSLGAHIDAQTDAGFTALHLAPGRRGMAMDLGKFAEK